MVQFLSIFFSWISSIFVGVFKSSRFFVSSCITEYSVRTVSIFLTAWFVLTIRNKVLLQTLSVDQALKKFTTCFLFDPEVSCLVHRNLLMVPILSQIIPSDISPPGFTPISVYTSLSPHVCLTLCPSHSYLFDHSDKSQRRTNSQSSSSSVYNLKFNSDKVIS